VDAFVFELERSPIVNIGPYVLRVRQHLMA
jgi:hypothetical protein